MFDRSFHIQFFVVALHRCENGNSLVVGDVEMCLEVQQLDGFRVMHEIRHADFNFRSKQFQV